MLALFNADLPAAYSGVFVSFFTTSSYGSLTGTISNGLTLDTSLNTWETNAVTGAIPAGTRWLLAQVAYQDASLMASDGTTHPAYVDGADLSIRAVPEPVTMSMLALGGLGMLRRRRSQAT